MLMKLEARSARGSLLELPLEGLDTGLLIDDIGGLSPVKATITSTSFAQLDGSQYQSSRREERNITMTIELEPDYAVETVKMLRDRVYRYFMPKAFVSLKFYDSDPASIPVQIEGRVESCDNNMFDPESKVDISIICNNPDFYEPDPVIFNGLTTSTNTEDPFPYLGTVETGFLFTLNVNRALGAFSIYLRNEAGEQNQIDFGGTLQDGDVLSINTVQGLKYVRLLRGGVQSSYLYGIPAMSEWLELEPGDNTIRVYATGAPIPYSIEYIRKFGAI